MSKTQIFIEKARAKHGDLYDYGRVAYVRAHDKVTITCKNHGDFEQAPTHHLAGKGCAKCAGVRRYSTQEWIQEAVAVHGDRYDYSKVFYIHSKGKVIITCAKHGDFEQRPAGHLMGKGCIKCGFEEMAVKQSEESKNSFIARARTAHGDRYDYSKAVYTRVHDKVIITCTKHGDFEQSPSNHLRGDGCAKCGSESVAIQLSQDAKDGFIGKSRAVHDDRYDYSRVFYIRNKDKVVIACKIHGDFEQAPSDHLNGAGCPSCPKRYDQPTNLYLMYNGLGKVKVGYAIDLNRRIKELNSNAPFKAELLKTWMLTDTPTARKIESRVHRKLAKYHAGLSGFDGATEWFDTTPEVAKDVIMKSLI